MKKIALQQKMFAIARPGYVKNLDDIILESSESVALRKREEESEMSGEEFVLLDAVISVQVSFRDGMAYIPREKENDEAPIIKEGIRLAKPLPRKMPQKIRHNEEEAIEPLQVEEPANF